MENIQEDMPSLHITGLEEENNETEDIIEPINHQTGNEEPRHEES